MNTIETCEGYLRLKERALRNIEHGWNEIDVNKKFDWVIKRAEHYAEKLNLPINDILNSWEDDCDYSFVNYYQDANQPLIENDYVRVFDTIDDLLVSIGEKKFRCPCCNGISTNPYNCNSNEVISSGKPCDWKVYGLFMDLGKGVYIYIKDKLKGETMFMPLSWEIDKGRND